MKHHFTNCKQDLIVQKQAWEAFTVKPTAGVHSAGTILMTKILPNEQTLQFRSDRAKKIQISTIRENHLWFSSYHRGPELSSDTRPRRVILCFRQSVWMQLTSPTPDTTAVIHVRLARLRSICSRVRPKPLRVNPRNTCTWCRISSKGLFEGNHTLIQQAATDTWPQPSTKGSLLGHSPKEGDQTLDHCLVWRTTYSCWCIDCFAEGSHQRQKIKTTGSKAEGLTRGERKISENGSSLLDKSRNWCRPSIDD